MNKLRLLALATLCMTGVSMANPAIATGEITDNSTLPPVSDTAAVISIRQPVENNKLLVDTSGMSDEVWLLFAAMLALAGIVIIHKTSH